MDESRCSICKMRLTAMTDGTGRTQLVCLECDDIDPMKTDAVKWANSNLSARDHEHSGQRLQSLEIALIGNATDQSPSGDV
jgi:hypothetical protein